MRWLARQLTKRPVAWAVVAVVVVLTLALGRQALRVEQDDDLLAFLPRSNPDVASFYEINEIFGGLDVAIVGIQVDNPFAGDFLQKLEVLSRELNAEPTVSYALSLANVEDFRLDPEKGGMVAGYLAQPIPKTPQDEAALRTKVMSKEHIVGNLVSADGKAVIIYNFLRPDSDPRITASMVRRKVNAAFPDKKVYWGGAPFISTYIYDLTLADMKRLIPWAVLAIVVIIVASFRDAIGATLALFSTALGIVVAYGLMGIAGVDANIVLSSMPVILFAVGSAYAIHILVRYYALRVDHDVASALEESLVQVGPTVIAAGLTTVAGLLSFLAMDIRPMREFGLFTGIGIFATLLLAVTFVPAVITLSSLRAHKLGESAFSKGIITLTRFARRKRALFAVVLGAVALAGAAFATRVEARMENAAFFSENSPPDRAERFLREEFGGSQFIQIEVRGDMNDPGVLREVQRVADEISLLDHVSATTHVGEVLSLVNESMVGERRLPTTSAQVRVLYRFLAGRPAIAQLVSDDRTRALIHVKVDTDENEAVDVLLDQVERFTHEKAVKRYRLLGRPPETKPDEGQDDADEEEEDEPRAAPKLSEADAKLLVDRRTELVLARFGALSHRFGARVDEGTRAALAKALAEPPPHGDTAKVVERLVTFLRSDESLLEEDQHAAAEGIAKAVVALGPTPTEEQQVVAIKGALIKVSPECEAEGDEDDGPAEGAKDEKAGDRTERCAKEAKRNEALAELAGDLAASLETPVREAWRQVISRARVDQLVERGGLKLVEGEAGERMRRVMAHALMDLDTKDALVASADGKAEMSYLVNGVPVLYRGLSRSVTENQFKSLGLALGLVLIILMALFRSPLSGLLAAAPTVLTLLAIYGAMGAMGMHLDIGTSMLASIIIGAGVDYAVHLLAAWRAEDKDDLGDAAARAAERAGPAIWTNAIMVAAGFFILTLGEAKPLKNVGGLTATAMILAALATFVAIPVFARKRAYGKQNGA